MHVLVSVKHKTLIHPLVLSPTNFFQRFLGGSEIFCHKNV